MPGDVKLLFNYTFFLLYFIDECPTGTYYKSGACEACAEGTFQDKTAQTNCKPCPGGPSSVKGAYSCRRECCNFTASTGGVANVSQAVGSKKPGRRTLDISNFPLSRTGGRPHSRAWTCVNVISVILTWISRTSIAGSRTGVDQNDRAFFESLLRCPKPSLVC